MELTRGLERLKWRLRKRRNQYRAQQRDFAFVHINKCGGSSIEHSLGLPFAHATAADLRELFGHDRWDRIYRFTVVRNPYARVASLYSFRTKTDQTGMGDSHIGFEDWVFEVFERQNPLYRDKPRFFMPCRDWLTDAEGRMLVDHVFRLEEIDRAWPEIQRATGCTAALRHDNASPSGTALKLYTEASRAVVTKAFAADLDAFGYDFPGGAAPARTGADTNPGSGAAGTAEPP